MNRLNGVVTGIRCSGGLIRVDATCGEASLSAYLLHERKDAPSVGSNVQILFKESEAALAKGPIGLLSLRNRFEGEVTQIRKGDLLAEVSVDFNGEQIVSIISVRACEEMELQRGDRVTVLVKANEITLMEVVDG